MADRRRAAGPSEGTSAPIFGLQGPQTVEGDDPRRGRAPHELRNIFLRTSLSSTAAGSAYLELPSAPYATLSTYEPPNSTLKMSCMVYGPRPVPPNVPLIPFALLKCELKFAPMSSPHRRHGYDRLEQELSDQLAATLRKSVDLCKYPKSLIDVIIMVIDCEGDVDSTNVSLGYLGILAGATTCASAAIAEAGIECIDLVSGGVSALIRSHDDKNAPGSPYILVQDPSPEEHVPGEVVAGCAAVYMAHRQEVAAVWFRGSVQVGFSAKSESEDLEILMDGAIAAAVKTREVLEDAIRDRFRYILRRAGMGRT